MKVGTTNYRRGVRKGAALLLSFSLVACNQVESTEVRRSETYDEGLGLDPAALTGIGGTCSFSSGGASSGTMTIALADGDVALLARRSDGVVTINDTECVGATAWASSVDMSGAPGAVVKLITVTTSHATGGAAERVIVDYINGTFALGTSTAAGINVDLKDGIGDQLSVRGTEITDAAKPDNILVGPTAINYTNATTADATKDINYTNVEYLRFALLDGDDIFSGAGSSTPLLGNGAATAPLLVYAGPGNDQIRGGSGNDSLYGNGGNDVFTMATTADGNDAFVGGAGIDTVSYGGAPTVDTDNIPTAIGSSGMRTSVVRAVADGSTACGEVAHSEVDLIQTDVEVLIGSSVGDLLTGNGLANTIWGGAGNDVISGGAGDDELHGGVGNDTFDEGSSANGSDVFNGEADSDTVNYSSRSMGLTITMDGVNADDGETDEGDDVNSDVESVLGGSGSDTITAGTAGATITGGNGDDTITGGDGNDTITGGAGDDWVLGGNGDDSFREDSAANGNDAFSGGAGKDTVDSHGRSANLTIIVDGASISGDLTANEADIYYTDIEGIIGGSGDDTITSGPANDALVGNGGADTLSSMDGNDTVEGDGGTDVIDCGAGDSDGCFDPTDCPAALHCEY